MQCLVLCSYQVLNHSYPEGNVHSQGRRETAMGDGAVEDVEIADGADVELST